MSQDVKVRVGSYVPGGFYASESASVDSHSEARFTFATTPPSFAEVHCGLGPVTMTWTGGGAPNWPCRFWVWHFRYPSGAQWGEEPIR